MEKTQIRLKKLRSTAVIPTFGSPLSAGADLYACVDADTVIGPGLTVMIPTGVALEIPTGHVGLVCARSGLSTRRGLAPANKVGVIDADYRGEITVALHNHGSSAETVAPGERIAQLLIVPILSFELTEADSLSGTERGSGGFGSTGSL